MSIQENLKTVHQGLKAHGIEHALIGGLALAAHGIQRATLDVDFLVNGKRKVDVKKLMEGLQWTLAMETDEVLHFDGRGRVDFLLANRPLTLEMISVAKDGALGIPVVSPEGLIGLKIQAYKNNPRRELQDKADILSILERFPELDLKKVREFADLFGEWETVIKLRETL